MFRIVCRVSFRVSFRLRLRSYAIESVLLPAHSVPQRPREVDQVEPCSAGAGHASRGGLALHGHRKDRVRPVGRELYGRGLMSNLS